MRYGLILLWMLFWSASPAMAQVSIGIGLPGVSIGINLPVYPELVRVPGYPVYYAPSWTRTTSSTTACTGSTRETTGTRVPGTTGPGRWWTRRCAVVRAARPGALLPASSRVLPRLATGCAAALGRALGQSVGSASQRWDRWNRKCRPGARPAASLSAAVFRESLSAPGAAAGAAEPELSLPAARRHSAAAL